MRKTLALLATLLVILAPSCHNRAKAPNPEVLSENRMVALLIDLHLVDGALQAEPNLIPQERMDKALYVYPSLLDKHGITRAQADSSINWYSNNPKKFARVYQRVVNELSKKEMPKSEPDTTGYR